MFSKLLHIEISLRLLSFSHSLFYLHSFFFYIFLFIYIFHYLIINIFFFLPKTHVSFRLPFLSPFLLFKHDFFSHRIQIFLFYLYSIIIFLYIFHLYPVSILYAILLKPYIYFIRLFSPYFFYLHKIGLPLTSIKAFFSLSFTLKFL